MLNGKPLLPLLFITIACGACSGFHGIVASGTTSKQLARERDARPVGYGAMLLEALVAVLALATVMALAPGSPALKEDPNLIYARGIARYLGMAGIDPSLALSFALLAFSTFVYDTLDVCTRLARYILQEFTGLKGRAGVWLATAATLVLPLLFLLSTKEKGYLVAWPIFGSSNQLLAALTLLALAVWLKHQRPPHRLRPAAAGGHAGHEPVVAGPAGEAVFNGQHRFRHPAFGRLWPDIAGAEPVPAGRNGARPAPAAGLGKARDRSRQGGWAHAGGRRPGRKPAREEIYKRTEL